MFMFDIETLGKSSESVLLSLACIHFDPRTDPTYKQLKESAFFVKLDAKDQVNRLPHRPGAPGGPGNPVDLAPGSLPGLFDLLLHGQHAGGHGVVRDTVDEDEAAGRPLDGIHRAIGGAAVGPEARDAALRVCRGRACWREGRHVPGWREGLGARTPAQGPEPVRDQDGARDLERQGLQRLSRSRLIGLSGRTETRRTEIGGA